MTTDHIHGNQGPVCDCDHCKTSKIIQGILDKCTGEEQAVLEDMRSANMFYETERDWNIGKAQDKEPIMIGGVWYFPKETK